MKIKVAILDMDGTLLDSMKYWGTVGKEYLEKKGIDVDLETQTNILNIGILRFTEICNERFCLNVSYEEVLNDLHLLMEEKYNSVVTLKTGAKEMLERFKQNGVKMCIATATEQKTAQHS